MGLLIYFATIRLIYSLFERREFKCILVEFISCSSFLIICLVLIRYWKSELLIAAVFITYIGSAILSLRIVPKSPIEALSSNLDQRNSPIVWFGIIDAVWLSLMSVTCALIFGGYLLHIIGGPLPAAGRSAEYYRAAIDESYFFLGFITNGILATGAALGACMAILWAGEIWRKHDDKTGRQYREHTLASIKMVTAYFSIVLAAFGWASIPLYKRIVELRELMPHLK